MINSKTIKTKGRVTEVNKYRFFGLHEIWELYINGILFNTEEYQTDEYQTDENGNQVYYIRKDSDEKSLVWLKRDFGLYGNQISIVNGIEVDKPTYKTTIQIKYMDKKNAC